MYRYPLTNRTLITILAVFVFYTNIPLYLHIIKFPSFIPLYWMILLGFIALCTILPSFFIRSRIPVYFSKPVICWIVFYLLINMIWLIPSDKSVIIMGVFRQRVLTVLFFSLYLIFVSGSKDVQFWGRITLLLCVFIAVVSNIYEFLCPFSFVPNFSPYANPGRSAGFYVNANGSGNALILGMIFTIGLLPQKYRIAYVLLVLLAIVFTFSRAALLGWFIVIFVFMRVHILRRNHVFFSMIIIGLLLVFLLPWFTEYMQSQKDINATNITQRIDWFFNPFSFEDSSSLERKYVAHYAWKMFTDSPLWGNGIGSAEIWEEVVSTHNMYLYFMTDFGVVGVFILPMFLLAVVWKARGEARQIAFPFATFVLFWGFFSHNVVEDYVSLVAFALMAAMTYQSRLSDGKIISN